MADCIISWQADTISNFGAEPVRLDHGLHRSPLFADAALAQLIESSRRENYYVNTMDVTAHDLRSRREGTIDIPGAAVLEAVRRGQIWILIQNPELVDQAYGELRDSIYREMADRVMTSPAVDVYDAMLDA